MNTIIGYDLDGIFVNDVDVDESFDAINKFRNWHCRPLFVPDGDFVIVTGRPIIDFDLTIAWLHKHSVKPVHLFHGNLDLTNSIQYKADVLNSNPQINLFIESCAEQVEALRQLCSIPIIHFESLIKRAIWEKFT